MDEETNFAVRKLLTMVETTNMYYTSIKVLNLKNELIAKKAVLNSTKNYVTQQFNQFRYIGEKIHLNYHNFFLKMRKMMGQRVSYRDGGSKSSIVSFKKPNNMRRPMSIKDLKSAVLSIQKLILFNFNMGKDFPLKGISFKLESFGYKELIVS